MEWKRRKCYICTNLRASQFVIFLFVCGVLVIFFLLYFNRLFASVISYALRSYTWHRYNIYLDIGALQISLLGGRIFFTGLRYHGSNESFLIHHGYVTWRYWYRRVREVDIVASSTFEGDAITPEKNAALPSRIHVNLIGLEWFVYNRSPAYDSILDGLMRPDAPGSSSSGISNEKQDAEIRQRKPPRPFEDSLVKDEAEETQNEDGVSGKRPRRPSTASRSVPETDATLEREPELPSILQLFPIRVECTKAAAVIGNDNTKAILIVKADSILTDIDATSSDTSDPYRQTFKVDFKHPVIEMKENEDYKEDQVTKATREQGQDPDAEPTSRMAFFRRQRRRVMGTLRDLIPSWRRSVESFSSGSPSHRHPAPHVPNSHQWQGLSRYIEDRHQDDKARWSSVEYAAVSTIVDSPSAILTVYWDAVAKVTAEDRRHEPLDNNTRINGTRPPVWGMHIVIKGGNINYGPWADRQRADLQRVFFPSLSKNAKPAVPLPVGAWRVPTVFTLNIDLEDAVTLRIPTREDSKNWRWRSNAPQLDVSRAANKKKRGRGKKTDKGDTAELRPFGWLEFKLPSNSTVSYMMDMLASEKGYTNRVEVDLPSTELWSSVNQDVLWRSGPQKISCDLSNPLTWNTLRTWHFDISCHDLSLYLLRDHIFLLIDLVDDWGSGPPAEYLVFTPFKYMLQLDFKNLNLFMNVNDANIIDKATVLEDNAYLILSSPNLRAKTVIPLDRFRPAKNSIPFDVHAESCDLSLRTPQSNTQAAFLGSNELGHLDGLTAKGSYQYNATTSTANTDTLILNLHAQSPYVYLYGFVIRYFILMKDNYFGEHVHFRTLQEYQEHLVLKAQQPDAQIPARPPHKKSNDLDIILGVKVEDPRIFIPANIYSATKHVQCELASLSVDLRFTNYYMELELDLSPLNLSSGNSEGEPDSPNVAISNTQMFIDGVRVYGHRTFGLPPTEPTYLCLWDVAVGNISGECTADFLASLSGGGAAFGMTFDDVENALVPYSSLIFYDITFAHVVVDSIDLSVHVEEAAFSICCDTIQVNSNDWARSHYSRRANIHIPNIQVSCLNAEDVSRHRHHSRQAEEADLILRTNVQVAIIGRKYHFVEERRLQQELVRREDQRTQRTPFLILDGILEEFVPEPTDPPAQDFPHPPEPLDQLEDDADSIRTSTTSRKSLRIKRQQSFLSTSSASIKNGQRSRRQPIETIPNQRTDNHPSGQRWFSNPGRTLTNNGTPGGYDGIQPLQHSSVAFSSQYFTPHFHSTQTKPYMREAESDLAEGQGTGFFSEATMALDDVDPSGLSEDHPYTSFLVEFPSGVDAFIKPDAIRHVASLLNALQPHEPEDILDNLQAGAMGNISDIQKQERVNGEVKELMLRLPKLSVRFLNSSALDSSNSSQEEQDQHDITISKVALVTRTTTDWDSAAVEQSAKSRTSLHLRIGTAELSASERTSTLQNPQAAVLFQVDRVVVSVGAREVTYIDADVGSVVGSTASGKFDYLASLIHRTGTIATELAHHISGPLSSQSNRVKYLVSRLLEEGTAVNDPAFLVRPSAILRSVNQHLRTRDSWKMASRLRQIWTVLGPDAKLRLADECQKPPEARADSGQRTISAFNKWRNWDLENPSNSFLIRKIFGRIGDLAEKAPSQNPLLGACRLSKLRLVLDPGPKQNQISLSDLGVRVQRKFIANQGDLPEVPTFQGVLTVLNLICGNSAININWELCELAENVLQLYSQNQSPTHIDTPSKKSPTPPKPTTTNQAFQVVAEFVEGSIDVNTINLRAKYHGDGLKVSFLSYKGKDSRVGQNGMIHANAIKSVFESHGETIGLFHLVEPSVFGAHLTQSMSDGPTDTVKATASSQSLVIDMKQDIIGLLEIVDLVVRDEVAQLHRLQDLIPFTPAPRKTKKENTNASTFRIDAVAFLDSYVIFVPLVPSLAYKISGVVARAACTAHSAKELVFDFDVKENSHDVHIDINNQSRKLSLLEVPPTNGRVTSHISDEEQIVTVMASVEVVQIDASSVYSLLTVLNRPQFASAVEEIQQQIKMLQDHVDDIFGGASDKPTPPSPVEPMVAALVYNVHIVWEGLQVSAQTTLKSKTEPIGQILFALDQIAVQASNRSTKSDAVTKYPDLYVNMKQIGFDIRRGNAESMRSCGNFGLGATVSASSSRDENGKEDWTFNFTSDELGVNLSPETVSTVVDVLGYMGDKIKDLDTTRELEILRKLKQSKPRIMVSDEDGEAAPETDILDSVLASVIYHFEMRNIRISWDVAEESRESADTEDLVLSIKMIEFGTKTRKSARLTIEDFQLQMVPPGQDRSVRALHSALLPELIFNVAYISTQSARRMAFQAVGQSLDLRLTSDFIVPAAHLAESISLSMKNARQASSQWNRGSTSTKTSSEVPSMSRQSSIFGAKHLESLLVDADFAGAVVHVLGRRNPDARPSKTSLAGKYGQFSTDDSGSGAVLRTPGLAWKAEYQDRGDGEPSLSGEIRIDASSNILYPSVVPIIMDIVSSIKEVVKDDKDVEGERQEPIQPALKSEKSGEGDNILTADPSAVLGRLKLDIGLRISRQEFSLSCQPIARVAATTSFEYIYVSVNTVTSQEQGNFFAISGEFSKPRASVQHVYSRESTGSFDIDEITLSLMNSKHVSGTSGVSAILNISPMRVSVNAKQVQDFLLFREIWYPKELRFGEAAPIAKLTTETSQGHIQRYQQVAKTAAFPWTATISIASLDVSVDFGQAIGKSVFQINKFWVSSKKTSDWEQNLCLGFDKIGIDCTGRLSGFIALQDFRLRTSIQWPQREEALSETPLVQASMSFNALRLKAAFDYQAFLVADITSLAFIMYNVRDSPNGAGDRLVANLDGESVQVFGTTSSAAQMVALFKAFQKLIQERRENFETSLRGLEKFMDRKSTAPKSQQVSPVVPKLPQDDTLAKSPISLDTDVIVTLKALNLGIFPNTFDDHRIFKLEALDAYARFAASIEDRRIHSILRLTLGQVRIGLASVADTAAPRMLSEVSVEEVVKRATGSRGGTILKVPRVTAVMQTWQAPNSQHIDYIFKSAFEGKVEVGWNYQRISIIRNMFAAHTKALEAAWGKELSIAAVKITGVPEGEERSKEGEQQKITAEVNVPQSKYLYKALEPPVIETPQLRDMGEATPPLEWIGLHRDRLPNLTHQIVITLLLELAGEVEDAYSRILGTT